MSYEISIGGVNFADTAGSDTRYALNCGPDAPQFAIQKASASGYEGNEFYSHGFRGRVIHPQVAYVGETCEADLSADLLAWGGVEVAVVADATTYTHCLLQGVDNIERYPGCLVVTFSLEQFKPN